ncbi:putative dynamin central domain, dynamin, GTPase domain, GTPase effector domain, Dynamin superfamily [Rosa chinensis]|uniref:Putative dynamin central domain, dynamin, GTPase domain, GTPase effector domain, Dynamin superfamily n=1 Tax=Rosa chinensis TaxID=74649 RepID=A0A2P6SAH4_ROSCH|nr:dynamin-related protein 4C [Rosa chinensis]XP_040369595.1 dynamin-related protein 4C [Rosa chinensis]PRQ55661.1 putative dynamin central domain, dynamin, GTPase domain, GTPase effector domain, Dynamin superfamily [Rosa chinensis]
MGAAEQTDLACISEGERSSCVEQHAIIEAAPIVSSYNDKIRPLLGAFDKLRSLIMSIHQIIKKMGASKQTDSACISEGEGSSCVEQHAVIEAAPIVSSYNDKIRPLLDAIDKLRSLMVMEEGIQLPTIVVVGDQSSGKSSVLESLAGISLPRGQGICTRVPLIMRLQHHSRPEPEFRLEYNGKVEHTDEVKIADDIVNATNVIAGGGKGISNTPLTLLVKKNGVPDLTMVDLPGITRVPVHGQPEDIYDQIKNMIMLYIKPEESIILNVLSATVDFTTCESIRMSQSVDKAGDRTLAVVTKVDKAPEGLLEKVTADDVGIGLGYVCVRNRIGDETYEEARAKSQQLFQTHPLLSKIDKSMVGIPVLAQKLVQIQASSIARNLPDIVKKINDRLSSCLSELNKMPKSLSSVAEAMTAFMQIIGLSKESLRKILMRGEFDEFPDDKHMHCTARLYKMLNQYSDQLHKCEESDPKSNFLVEEIKILEEANGISLPNFVPRNAFLVILQGKVKGISSIPVGFVEKVWSYIEEVVMSVLMHNTENYYQLQVCTRRAGHNLITRMKERSVEWTMEMVEMEKQTDYTGNPEYISEWSRLMGQQDAFVHAVLSKNESTISIEGIGEVEVGDLRQYPQVLLSQAFDLKMRITAYWKVVLRRLVDCMALHLQLSVSKLVNQDMEIEIVNELMGPNCGGGIEKMLVESPAVATKREKLIKSIKKLKDSKEIVAKILDGVAT